MKKYVVLSLILGLGFMNAINIFSTCLDHWDEFVSITRCDGTHGINCSAPYLAGLHKCCEPGTWYENCPPDNWYPTFVSYIGGSCTSIPCEGMNWDFCVDGTEMTDPDADGYLDPLPDVWAPHDRGLGVCWLPL